MSAKVEMWQARNERWYYHRVAGGRITDQADYASRRSCRRAILARWPRIRIEVLSADQGPS